MILDGGTLNVVSWESPATTQPGTRTAEGSIAWMLGWSRAVTPRLLAAVTLGSNMNYLPRVPIEIRLAGLVWLHQSGHRGPTC